MNNDRPDSNNICINLYVYMCVCKNNKIYFTDYRRIKIEEKVAD